MRSILLLSKLGWHCTQVEYFQVLEIETDQSPDVLDLVVF